VFPIATIGAVMREWKIYSYFVIMMLFIYPFAGWAFPDSPYFEINPDDYPASKAETFLKSVTENTNLLFSEPKKDILLSQG